MKKCLFTFVIALIALFSNSVYSQVGVGTMKPDSSAVLDVVSDTVTPLGALVPRMSESARDRIKKPANGLVIYNNDEDCFNYYSLPDTTWQSVCGKLGKAVIDSAYCSKIQVFGNYIQGVATTVNERIVIPVEVTKAGSYDATVVAMFNPTTQNEYTFTGSGTFLYTGMQTMTLTAQGTPKNVHFDPNDRTVGDNIQININGTDLNACNNITIPVIPAAADYDVTCGSAVVNGVYTMAPDQTNSDDATHYIDVNVNVNDIGTGGTTSGWSAETNKVNGEQFKGSGTFTTTGPSTIRLYAVPGTRATSLDPITLTMAFQTKNGEVDCQVTLRAAYPSKKIVIIGSNSGYGYNLQNTSSASYNFLNSDYNFGSKNYSTVKMIDNFTAASGYTKVGAFSVKWLAPGLSNDGPTWNQFLIDKPDIVIITYAGATISATAAVQGVINYLNAGGIVLHYTETSAATIVSAVFNTPGITGAQGPINTVMATLPNFQDPLLNGPFQPDGLKTLGGLDIAGDSETYLWYVSGLPSSGVIVYGYNTSSTASDIRVSVFRATGQRYLYFGDGGYFCNDNNGTWLTYTAEPFATTHDITPSDVTYRPAARPVVGTGSYPRPVYNSFFFANTLAWAINEAQFYGINSGN